MDIINTKVLSQRLYAIKEWTNSRIQPFYQWLSPLQRACFIMAMIPLPIYLFDGQVFVLMDSIHQIVLGAQVEVLPFVALLTETLLIIYTCTLVLLYQRASGVAKGNNKTEAYRQAHPCIVVCEVPLHLYHDEVKPTITEDIDFTKSFVGLNSEDQALIDSLPQAMEILKNNAAMLDIYEERHPSSSSSSTTPEEGFESPTESLLEMINRNRRPAIESAADLEELIKSTN